ncbi:MAG TPA: CoA transferase [Candidatus Binataceae bacterium]|nr:CoA transferase [Candidatus Binataceae bacterium]
MEKILDGIRVLDFGRYIAAPFCCQILADMGAEVIRVERPGGEPDRQRGPFAGDGQSLYFATLNRNKQAITLKQNTARGREVLGELVKHCDVLVHNQPRERLRELGLEYERLAALNPRLVYLAISGFGATGPYASDPAFDSIVQALSGAAVMTGFGDAPTLSHVPWVDFGTALYGALGVMLALFGRERSGRGREVELALLNTGLSFVGAYGVFAEAAINGIVRRAVGNNMIYGVGGMFRCADGALMVCTFGDALFARLCRVIGRPELLEDPALKSDIARYEHRDRINQAVQAWIGGRTMVEARRVLAAAGVPAGEVESVDHALKHPQVVASGMLTSIDQPGIGEIPVAASALRFDGSTPEIERPAPAIGEHNDTVYDRLLGPGSAHRLRDEGVI